MIRIKQTAWAALAGAVLMVGSTALAGFEVGPLTIGGAIRANYVNGDYPEDGTDAPQRGGNGGNFELDTFRVNLDLDMSNIVGKAEYRWYNGYNFIHTAYIGYELDEDTQIDLGISRVPFGVGAYGPANSWFFDQHYYVGLSDDMDLGVRYSKSWEDTTLDLAYYPQAEPEGQGASADSARYSYDVVSEDAGGFPGVYDEKHQFNARVIRTFESLNTDIGVSGQFGMLEADDDRADDTDAYAASIHSKTTIGNLAVMFQLTQYEYETDYAAGLMDDAGRPVSDDLIVMGAYDFAWPVASEGTVPALAISYTIKPESIDWIDSITFYNDYSVIMKDGSAAGMDLNDSSLNVTGFAIANDGWYIYVDYAISDGNYFVGAEGDDYTDYTGVGDFGLNGNDKSNGRFNINFGYYF